MAAKNRRIIYSDADCHRLVDIIINYRSIVENKKTDTVTWKEKTAAWEKITETYNLSTTEPRNSEQLRCKYDNLKKEVRKYEAAKKQMVYKTGGGTEGPDIKAALKLLFDKIKSIISFSINGLEPSEGDSDMLDVEEYCDREANIEVPNVSSHPIILNDIQVSEEIPTTSQPMQVLAPEVNKDWSDYTPKMLKSRKHTLLQIKRKKTDTSGGDDETIKWDLVCDRLALKATVQTAVSFGKFLGAFAMGMIADKYGRKVAFATASMVYAVAGPVVAFTSVYQILIVARVCLGIAGLGVFESAYSIVSEICPPEMRSTLGVLYNQSYPLGIIAIALIGNFIQNWRKLQLCISAPALLLALHVWLIPESPRWLYYTGRKKKAWKAVERFLPVDRANYARIHRISGRIVDERRLVASRWNASIRRGYGLLKNEEFRRRLFVCWIVWCFTAMSYYSLVISAESLGTNVYVYVALSGAVEAASYVAAVPLLRIIGRRVAATSFLTIAGFSLLTTLAVPRDMDGCKLVGTLLGRLCVSGVFCVVIVHAFELFPTTTRNTAVGTSSSMAHFGSIFAPYLVDVFSTYGWYVPSTICGVTLLVAGLLTQTLPETKGLPLYNTLQDLATRSRLNREERVSLTNCTPCSLFRRWNERRLRQRRQNSPTHAGIRRVARRTSRQEDTGIRYEETLATRV